MEEQLTTAHIDGAAERIEKLKGYLDIDARRKTLASLEESTQVTGFWDNNKTAQDVLKQIKSEKDLIEPWDESFNEVSDLYELFEMAKAEGDSETLLELGDQYEQLVTVIDKLEFIRKLNGEDDRNNAIITIHSGAGGTESCDWADMLFRMYMKWIENHDFKSEIVEITDGEEAGIKSVSVEVTGEFAYGHLKAELGVHRLVRISPFDSGARRHTSFASVFIYPVAEDVEDFELDDKDIRVDTYRASGSGGQHVNKTDSAVRLTHIPTNIVVQCQNQRSQIKNRAAALKMLKSRVKQHVKEEEAAKQADKLEDKKKIEWGSQIRSYVLHPYNMVKDHRTGYETSNTQAVLDGDIDKFIESFLLEF